MRIIVPYLKNNMKYITAIILFLFCIATSAMKDQTYQKPSSAILKQKLTPIQYHVTQEAKYPSLFKHDKYGQGEVQ